MRGFEDKIRRNFSREVTRNFEERDWDLFVKQKKRKKRPIWWIVLPLLILSSSLFLSVQNVAHWEVSMLAQAKEEQNVSGDVALELEETKGHILALDERLEDPSKIAAVAVETSPSIAKPKSKPGTTSIEADHGIILPMKRESTKGFELSPKDLGLVEIHASDIESARNKTIIEPLTVTWAPFEYQRHLGRRKITAIVDSKVLWTPKTSNLHGYVGLSFPQHIETKDEHARQLGIKIYHALGKRLRIKVGTEYSLVNYKSHVMDPRLGVARVDAPGAGYSFSDVIVESTAANFQLGIDALVLSGEKWQVHAGIAHGLGVELMKDVDYAFVREGQDEDFILSVADAKRYLEPSMLLFETGVLYKTRIADIGITVQIPWQYKLRNQYLFEPFQINFGIAISL